uniref:Uncharacterized protein n=1 Tax=Oryza brachyantha TaxID=4533 RepID=J3MB95_ORYBR
MMQITFIYKLSLILITSVSAIKMLLEQEHYSPLCDKKATENQSCPHTRPFPFCASDDEVPVQEGAGSSYP